MRRLIVIISTLFLCFALFGVSAQGQDTIPGRVVTKDTITVSNTKKIAESKIAETKPKMRNSTKALLWSIIPGGGQVYNKQYWKLPIIVGAYTACYYAISWNNGYLTEYSNAYRDIKSDRPLDYTSWQNFIPYGANPESYINNTSFQETLKRGRDFYRRYRDLSIIITAGVYLLVIVDAYVDAELASFDISPNLTMSYSPTYIAPINGTDPSKGGFGMHLALSF